MPAFALYCRVSTKRQSLGLQAQRELAERYVRSVSGTISAIFEEQESGKNDARQELSKAIQYCKETHSTLLIAKLDRLSRNVEFLFKLRSELDAARVQVVAADMPDLLNNTLALAVIAGLAQQEREMISKRTKESLSVLKKSGKKLGRSKGCDITYAQKLAVKAIENKADKFAKENIPVIKALYDRGISLSKIAKILNEEKRKTRRGKNWTATAVRRIICRAQ